MGAAIVVGAETPGCGSLSCLSCGCNYCRGARGVWDDTAGNRNDNWEERKQDARETECLDSWTDG